MKEEYMSFNSVEKISSYMHKSAYTEIFYLLTSGVTKSQFNLSSFFEFVDSRLKDWGRWGWREREKKILGELLANCKKKKRVELCS